MVDLAGRIGWVNSGDGLFDLGDLVRGEDRGVLDALARSGRSVVVFIANSMNPKRVP